MKTKRISMSVAGVASALVVVVCLAVVSVQAKPQSPAAPRGVPQEAGSPGATAPAAGLVQAAVPAPFDPDGAKYVLTAWSVSGLKQFSDCDAYFSLGPPFASFRAELVKRGVSPERVTKGVVLAYAVENMAKPSSVSQFYTFSKQLTGKTLEADTGPQGNHVSGFMHLEKSGFLAQDVPVAPYDSKGVYQPYPTVRLEARDEATGQVLAATRTALAVSTEFNCADCHGGKSDKPGISAQTAQAILTAHDKLSKTTLLAEAKAGKPQACASCHEGATLLSLTASMHGFHAAKVTAQGAGACAPCHPAGPLAKLGRDHHQDRGQDCVSCHGTLPRMAAGLLAEPSGAGNKTARKLMAALGTGVAQTVPRSPGMQPDCKACHDFQTRPLLSASADGKWTSAKQPPYNARPDEASGLACAACHGPAHALYPSHDAFGRYRDALVPMQLQGANAPLGARGNCAVCHTEPMDPATSVHHPLPARSGTLVSLPENLERTKPRVLLPHREHAGLDCKACHHKGYSDGQSLKCSTSGCHTNIESGSQDPLSFRNAFHGPGTSCFACHQTLKKAGKPFGPVECSGCHNVKQESSRSSK